MYPTIDREISMPYVSLIPAIHWQTRVLIRRGVRNVGEIQCSVWINLVGWRTYQAYKRHVYMYYSKHKEYITIPNALWTENPHCSSILSHMWVKYMKYIPVKQPILLSETFCLTFFSSKCDTPPHPGLWISYDEIKLDWFNIHIS